MTPGQGFIGKAPCSHGADPAPRARTSKSPAVVWLHKPAKSYWAAMHTVKRHGGRVEAVLTLLVDVPRAWLRRNRAGLWYSVRGIPPRP
jgi:hypothetical protein